ncbi:TAP Cterminal subfamily protein [Pelomyxa schiedti]|nr:TAP Cterminal subfamily protein [Pelomyxa schiedti]
MDRRGKWKNKVRGNQQQVTGIPAQLLLNSRQMMTGRGVPRLPIGMGETAGYVRQIPGGYGKAVSVSISYKSGGSNGPTVVISPWKPNFKVPEVQELIQVKLGKPITFSGTNIIGSKLFLSVPTQDIVTSIQAISPLVYKNTNLTLAAVQQPTLSPAKSLEQAFTAYVHQAYNKQAKFLDLSSIQSKINVQADLNLAPVFLSLWKVMWSQCPQIESISFAGNKLTTLRGLGHSMAVQLRDLKNFSFSNNCISELEELDHLKRLRVRELDLRMNPVFSLANYQGAVERKFPQLRILDGAQVQMLRRVASLPSWITTGVADLPPCIPNFSDSDATRQTAAGFITRFFDKFDKDRGDLVASYTDQSFFSMSLLGCRSLQDSFRDINRNILRLTGPSDKPEILRFGKQSIQQLIGSLPTTVHDPNDFSFDSYVVQSIPGAALLSIHCYGRVSMNAKDYAFTRTFLLAPNTSGVNTDIWPVLILNDQLHLDDFKTLLVTPQTNDRSSLMARLMQQTRLIEVYAEQCLSSTNWNYDEALAQFQKLQASGGIPPSCYQP